MWVLTIFLLVSFETLLAEGQCIVTKFDQVSTAIKNCTDIVIDNLAVPGGQQLVLHLNPGSTLTFRGRTTFDFFEWDGPLIDLKGSDIVVRGEPGSIIDGQGPLWWDGQGTWGNTSKPRVMKITVDGALMENLYVKNCPLLCVLIRESNNTHIRGWTVDNLEGDEGVAPPNKFGHNTDGLNVAKTYNLVIENTVVYNQDDCVAVNSGKNITVRNMFCHGSHGLSVSATGQILEDVLFADSIVTMAQNGIHIKTHVDQGEGLVRNVTYSNITLLDSTEFGINIQQNYRNLPAGHPQDGPPDNNIPIRDLKFKNIFGNVLQGAVPVYVLCAEEGCFDWKWENVHIFGQVHDNCTNFVPDGYDC